MPVVCRRSLWGLTIAVCGVLAVLLAACSSGGGGGGSDTKASATVTITPRPKSTPTPQAQGLRQQAEQSLVPKMSQYLADLVRKQPWYQEMTPVKLSLVANLAKCEQAAQGHGESSSVADALGYASEQPWYADGLDDREAKGLSEVFDAYALSFTKDNAPPVGAMLSTTLRYKTFDVTTLPETGDKVVIIASKDQTLGQKALQIATENLPKIEAIAGKFPYPFIYIEVTPDYPPELGGMSYDEFIGINNKDVNTNVISHELTHSTVYGSFPTWFEEGFAYFMGNYVSDQLVSGTASANADLRQIKADNKVDVGTIGLHPGLYSGWDYFAETRRGFLFVKSLYDIEGIDGLSKTVKALRSKTYNDNELLIAIMTLAPSDLQSPVRNLYCDRIVGATHNYCVASQ